MSEDIEDKISPDEEKRLIDVLMSLDISDIEKLKIAVNDIIKVRLATELKVQQGIGVGIVSEEMTVQEAAKLLNQGKDSLSDLVKLKRLLDGETTDELGVSIDVRDAIADQVRRQLEGRMN